ncbi:helix-turn-helix transcriptional regulator [Streptomyces viridosporus]|uniref:helix-turn-helix transcriptional regulator n=1 Tax=Streptomyces viridosporus TaxID=67581 RepID=UPI0033346FD0
MADEPFRVEQIEEKAMEIYVGELLTLADKIKNIREAIRKDADTLYRRLQRAGYVRRLWKQTEETMPALIAEAYAADWTVADIAHELGVSESYVYRVLRERRDQ